MKEAREKIPEAPLVAKISNEFTQGQKALPGVELQYIWMIKRVKNLNLKPKY